MRIRQRARFNAGVRAWDIRNPQGPIQVGFYVPAAPNDTYMTNNVEVDNRGFIYAVDRANAGMHILDLTDEAKQELTRRPEAGTPPYTEN